MVCNDQNLTRTGLGNPCCLPHLKLEITGLFGSDNITPVGGGADTGGLAVLDGTALL